MRVEIPERFKRLRETTPIDHVSIGHGGIRLVPVSELEAAQRGYADVAGDTAWRCEWAVIGHEDLCGDPVFIDTEDQDYPVYTAEHGTGSWSPRLIAFTFRHFSQILQHLHVLLRGRANPVELERHPISAHECSSFIEFIRRESPQVDFGFWRSLLEVDGKWPNQAMQRPTASPRTASFD
jgi:hypothetical protein